MTDGDVMQVHVCMREPGYDGHNCDRDGGKTAGGGQAADWQPARHPLTGPQPAAPRRQRRARPP